MPAAVGSNAPLLLEIGAVVTLLALLGRLAVRFELSPIPLYLLAGVGLGLLGEGPLSFDAEVVEIGAQIGLVLLLFVLGLEYTGAELAESLRTARGPAALDGALNFVPGVLAGLLLGWSAEAALLLGGVTYISSSGIVAKLLADLDRVANRETPAILSILVMEDLAMAVYLPVMAALLAAGGAAGQVALLAGALAAAGVALFSAIRLGPAVTRLLGTRSDEVLLLSTMGLALLAAGAAEGARVSAAVGAFLAGIAVSGPVAARARALVSPLRDVFAAAFFVFFGLQIEVGAAGATLLAALALAAVTAATKLATGWRAAAGAGVGSAGRVRAGTVLVARGEFSIVIAGIGLSAGVEPELGALAAAYVLLTALAGSLATRWSDRIARGIRRRRPAVRQTARSSSAPAA